MINQITMHDLPNCYLSTIDGRTDAACRGFSYVVEPKNLKTYRKFREVCQQTLGDADVKLGGWIASSLDVKELCWADNQETHKMFFKSLNDITQAAFTMKLLAA